MSPLCWTVKLSHLATLPHHYLSELCEIRPLVHVSGPAFWDDFVKFWMAVWRSLKSIAVTHATHDLAGPHAWVRGGTWNKWDWKISVFWRSGRGWVFFIYFIINQCSRSRVQIRDIHSEIWCFSISKWLPLDKNNNLGILVALLVLNVWTSISAKNYSE